MVLAVTWVDIPVANVGRHSAMITLNDEVVTWLLATVGFGDKRFWAHIDSLEYHLTNCLGTKRCGLEMNYSCQGDTWGWMPVSSSFFRFGFRDTSMAMLFKLTWGGS